LSDSLFSLSSYIGLNHLSWILGRRLALHLLNLFCSGAFLLTLPLFS